VGAASGDIVEAFACGTAAVVAPIGLLRAEGFEIVHESTALALSLRAELTGIQYGTGEDRHGWMMRLDSANSAAGADSTRSADLAAHAAHEVPAE
jgi:branched-chain amino acid aminotransferase